MTRPGTPAGAGWFITFEGPEGAGKTTQVARAATFLAARGLDVLVTREPGGTWLGERLREVLLARTGAGAPLDARSDAGAPLDATTDALLFNAARRQLVTEVVRPAIEAGRVVLCARFADSTMAYQGYGAGVPLSRLAALEAAATDGLTPDLTILLDLPPEVGLRRKSPGEVTRFEADFDIAFHRRVRDGFLTIAAGAPDRVAIVGATAPEASVTAAIEAVLEARLTIRSAAGEPSALPVRTTR